FGPRRTAWVSLRISRLSRCREDMGMKKRLWWWPGWVCGFGLLIGGGCESAPRAGEGAAGAATPVDLEAKQSLAAKFDSPLVILVVESGRSRADNNAMTIFGTPTFTGAAEGVTTAGLDIRNSRNRATVERFHLQRTPLLLCLSSRGIIISRDDREVTADLAAARARQALEQGPGLDEQFAALKEAARENPTNAGAQFHLTDFLMAHGNAAEAIPILAGLAHAEAAAPRDRIRAWVELGRAHL